ncbi:hypothetical protein MTYP_01950 [Methylophilaceae bacterium]|nr:hypothetical protein MTYP_01950 [Methylophilaceae bacterium]
MPLPQPFIDSNVVLYLLSAEVVKADKAEAIISAGGFVSVQVLNEVTAVCRRKLGMPWQEIEILLSAVKTSCDVQSLTLESHQLAVELAKKYAFSFYDAHICASAMLSGAQILLSEDMQHGMVIEGLTIQNPFRS